MSRVGETLMYFGNWFLNVGVEYLKDHAAKVCYLTFGVCSMVPVLLDPILSSVLHFKLIRSCKYFGAMLVMHLNVVRILCFILCCMGGQCSFFRAHDEIKYLFFRISLVELFCMVWYFLRVFDDRPESIALA